MLLGLLMVLAPGAGADDLGPFPDGAVLLPDGGGRVPICHATSSETTPYIRNTPSVNAAGELFDSNHASHTGPVFAPGMKSAQPKIQWGDIIPPIAVGDRLVFQGSANWLDGGAAQYPVCSAVTEPGDPVVVVEKDVPGAADATEFAFTVDGYGDGPTAIAEGESFETTVDAGDITVTEAEAAHHTLIDVECTRSYVAEGELIEGEEMSDEWSGAGRSATFEARDGDVITCVFTNTPDALPTASISIQKTNDANGSGPFTEAEQASGPGAAVPFQVVISNTGETDLTLDDLTDTWDGLDEPVHVLDADGFACTRGGLLQTLTAGDTLPAGSVTTCSFELPGYAPGAGGSKTNTVVLTTKEGVGDDDTSTVTTRIPLTPTPTFTLRVDKRNDADGDGRFSDAESASAPGDDVTFQLTLRNTGTGALTLTSLTDEFDGELVDLLSGEVDLDCNGGAVTLTAGSVLAPGRTTTCSFELEDYAPASGDSRTNTITVGSDRATRVTAESTVATPEVLPGVERPPVGPAPVAPPVPEGPAGPGGPAGPAGPGGPRAPGGPAAQAFLPVAAPVSRALPDVRSRPQALPRTGDETGGLAGVGAFLLLLGAALVLGSKRQLTRR